MTDQKQTIMEGDTLKVSTPAEQAQFENTTASVEEQPIDPAVVQAQLEQRVRELEQTLKDSEERFLRKAAEVENVRRRAQEDVTKAHKFAVDGFARELLAVKDSLEMALTDQTGSADAIKNGVEITLKQLVGAFEKNGLQEVNPVNEKFDPHYHQAMTMIESEQPANTVINVLQKGYLIHDRVLRPALVVVSK